MVGARKIETLRVRNKQSKRSTSHLGTLHGTPGDHAEGALSRRGGGAGAKSEDPGRG
jgi:hypothetical protein